MDDIRVVVQAMLDRYREMERQDRQEASEAPEGTGTMDGGEERGRHSLSDSASPGAQPVLSHLPRLAVLVPLPGM